MGVKRMIHEKWYQVELSDVDFQQRIKLSALANKFQDLGNIASQALGVGFETIYHEYGVVWALVRLRLDIDRLPTLGENVLIRTWAYKPKSLQFDRDFSVTDEEGQVIIRAVSAWVILDYETRRIRKVSTIIHQNYQDPGLDRAIHCVLGRMKPQGQLIEKYQKVIGYSDIDLNGHLNNSKYIDFIMDCLSLDEHRRFQVQSLEVSFVSESLAGDTLTMYEDRSRIEDHVLYIEGVNQTKNQVSFRSQLLLSPTIKNEGLGI